jgi:S-formylglutathione hydrolase
MTSTVTLHEISSPHLPEQVPYQVLTPSVDEPLPLCLLLLGGGETRDALFDLEPLFNGWWANGVVPHMIVATPSAGLDYYLENPAGSLRWDSFLAIDFVPHLRSTRKTGPSVVAGISAGGYGALKLAFSYPRIFAAVAALQPMLEPGFR